MNHLLLQKGILYRLNQLKSGHIFHAITYGLNAMGPHASQITEQERWKIVLHVQKLQGEKLKEN